MDEERDFYGDNSEPEREIIGYCAYSKDPIYEGDDYVEYQGQLYLKEYFIIMNVGEEKGINDD
jgi:hypothetical protein